MIPQQLTSEHILRALKKIDVEGVPDAYQSTKFDLLYEGKLYPPKYAISLAHEFINGEKWSHELFSGGDESNNFLKSKGFQIVPKDKTSLTLSSYEEFSREEVHEIFSPHTTFTPQAGTWGLQGIVSIPNRTNDFVVFVTYGQQAGDHVFDEGITEDGVLTWQSQPRQSLSDKQIQQLINHDELRNSIHLFLRTKLRGKYTYLGRLKYLSHDTQREKPVHFQWQILDWNVPQEVLKRMELELQPASLLSVKSSNIESGKLQETPPPTFKPIKGMPTPTFRTRKVADYSERDARNKELGNAGEVLVYENEIRVLIENGKSDLAERVRHISLIEGDGAGYDIESYTTEGEVKYIEVKTTKGTAETPFFMTSNEVAFARQHPENFYLYRVYDFDGVNNNGNYYIKKGKIEENFTLASIQYRVSLS